MQSVPNLARLVQRRLRLQRWVNALVPAACVALASAGVIVAITRWFGESTSLYAVVVSVAVGAGLLWFLLRQHAQPSLISGAAQADEQLHLDGRLASALALSQRSDGFAQAAVQDAERAANEPGRVAQAREAFQLRWPRSSYGLLMLAALLLAQWWLQPVRAQIAEPAQDALVDVAQMNARADTVDAGVAEALQTLEENPQTKEQLQRMLDELSKQVSTPRDAMASANDAAEREAHASQRAAAMEKILEQQLNSEESLQAQQFKDVLASMPEMKDLPNELSQALKSGDIQSALQQLEKLAAQAAGSDPAKAAEAKKAIEKIADAMQTLAKDQSAAQQALKQAGMDPTLASNPAQAQKAIEQNKSLTPEQKKALQKKLAANAKVCENCKNIGKSMREVASGTAGGMSKAQQEMSRAASNASMHKALMTAMSQCKNGGAMGWSMPWQKHMLGAGKGGNNAKGGKEGGEGGDPNVQGNTAEMNDPLIAQKQESAGDGNALDPAAARDFVRGVGAPIGASSEQLKAVAAKVTAGLEEGTEEDPVPGRLKAAHKRYFEQWKKQLQPTQPVGGTGNAGNAGNAGNTGNTGNAGGF